MDNDGADMLDTRTLRIIRDIFDNLLSSNRQWILRGLESRAGTQPDPPAIEAGRKTVAMRPEELHEDTSLMNLSPTPWTPWHAGLNLLETVVAMTMRTDRRTAASNATGASTSASAPAPYLEPLRMSRATRRAQSRAARAAHRARSTKVRLITAGSVAPSNVSPSNASPPVVPVVPTQDPRIGMLGDYPEDYEITETNFVIPGV